MNENTLAKNSSSQIAGGEQSGAGFWFPGRWVGGTAMILGPILIVSTLNAFVFFGWVVLAIGSYLSGVLGLPRSIALGLMTALMFGVLKGSSPISVIATGGLCVALAPLGIKVLREGPRPSRRAIVGWSFLIIGALVILFFLGQAG